MEKETKPKQSRGALTEAIKQKSKELLDYEIDVRELRLMPYIQFQMVNNQKLGLEAINKEELAIIEKWQTLGYIQGDMEKLVITKKFWDIVNEIIYLGYVDLKD